MREVSARAAIGDSSCTAHSPSRGTVGSSAAAELRWRRMRSISLRLFTSRWRPDAAASDGSIGPRQGLTPGACSATIVCPRCRDGVRISHDTFLSSRWHSECGLLRRILIAHPRKVPEVLDCSAAAKGGGGARMVAIAPQGPKYLMAAPLQGWGGGTWIQPSAQWLGPRTLQLPCSAQEFDSGSFRLSAQQPHWSVMPGA